YTASAPVADESSNNAAAALPPLRLPPPAENRRKPILASTHVPTALPAVLQSQSGPTQTALFAIAPASSLHTCQARALIDSQRSHFNHWRTLLNVDRLPSQLAAQWNAGVMLTAREHLTLANRLAMHRNPLGAAT